MVQASATLLEVEVPEVVVESGAERRVSVVVRKGGRASRPVDVAVFQGPRLHGISPEAAMPGEEVLLAGAGWGPGATVRFGDAEAQLNEVESTRIRAVVPEGAGGPGTPAPVVVTVGGVESNPAPFIVGHLPVVSGVSPASAAPGDLVDVSGRGFQADPLRNDVRVGGVPALVLSAAGDALKVVVPRVGPGEASRALEVRVPGSDSVGQAVLAGRGSGRSRRVPFRRGAVRRGARPAPRRPRHRPRPRLRPRGVRRPDGGGARGRGGRTPERRGAGAAHHRGPEPRGAGLRRRSDRRPFRAARRRSWRWPRKTRQPTTRTGPACAAVEAR